MQSSCTEIQCICEWKKIITNTPYSWDNARFINQCGVKGRKKQNIVRFCVHIFVLSVCLSVCLSDAYPVFNWSVEKSIYHIIKIRINLNDNLDIQVSKVVGQLFHSTDKRCFWFESKNCNPPSLVEKVIGFKVFGSWPTKKLKKTLFNLTLLYLTQPYLV